MRTLTMMTAALTNLEPCGTQNVVTYLGPSTRLRKPSELGDTWTRCSDEQLLTTITRFGIPRCNPSSRTLGLSLGLATAWAWEAHLGHIS